MSAWNPSDKNAFITLSGSNLVATGNSASNGGVRGTLAHNTGKWVLRYDAMKLAGDSLDYIGIGGAGTTLGLASGSQANQIIMIADGAVFDPAAPGGQLIGPDVSSGSTNSVEFAFDFDNHMVWVRRTGGTWSGNGNPADPVTGGGGLAIGTITAPLLPYTRLTTSNSFTTLNPSDPATLPSGYLAWDNVPPPPVLRRPVVIF